MTSAMLTAERIRRAAHDAYTAFRERYEREHKDWESDYGESDPIFSRINALGALADAAVASGQDYVSVSLDDYRIIHSYYANARDSRIPIDNPVRSW